MEVVAKLKFTRVQARKARIVARTVLNAPARVALTHLHHTTKEAANKIFKVLESAIANAENNYKLNPDNLKVKSIIVDSGPSYRRRRARSKGRAVPILKRTSHIAVTLAEIIPTVKKVAEVAKVADVTKALPQKGEGPGLTKGNEEKKPETAAKEISHEAIKPKVTVRSRKEHKS